MILYSLLCLAHIHELTKSGCELLRISSGANTRMVGQQSRVSQARAKSKLAFYPKRALLGFENRIVSLFSLPFIICLRGGGELTSKQAEFSSSG